MRRDYQYARNKMVKEDLIRRGIKNERVLTAMKTIPRHLFVPQEYQDIAYSDRPLPIGYRQTISQPYIVALMISMLDIHNFDNVLEIGTGSGYQTAILSLLCNRVFSIEIIPELAERAKTIIEKLKTKNVTIKTGDGNNGWKENTPYNGIIISAAAPRIPSNLLKQLAENGSLIAPVGGPDYQIIEKWFKRGTDEYTKETGIPVSFVPLVGNYRTMNDED